MKSFVLCCLVLHLGIASAFAQCAPNYPLFAANPNARIEIVTHLGRAPQIDFLRNIATSEGMVAALKANRNSKKYARDVRELNKVLTLIGFPAGIADQTLTAASFQPETLPYGRIGNLGSDDQSYKKVVLQPESKAGVPGWRITSPTGCFVYVFTKCGNFFYPTDTLTTTRRPKPDCCHNATVVISQADVPSVTCDKQTHTKKVVYCLQGYYINTSGKGKAPSYERIYLGRSDSLSVVEASNLSYTYSAILNPRGSQIVKVCKDETINIPVGITIKAAGASSASYSPTDDEPTILKIRIYDRKLFKQLQKRMKDVDCNPRRPILPPSTPRRQN